MRPRAMKNKADKCATCKHNGTENGWAACDGCIHDESLKDRYEPLTNGDKIRSAADEEFAKMLKIATDKCPPNMEADDGEYNCPQDRSCEQCWLEWLKAPVESKGET